MGAADWQAWITWRLVALFAGYVLAAVCCGGCDIDVHHRLPDDRSVDVRIGIDDACLSCFPACAMGAGGYVRYSCRAASGGECADCVVGCIGGKRRECEGGEPWCRNDSPTGEIDAPVVCVAARGDGGT